MRFHSFVLVTLLAFAATAIGCAPAATTKQVPPIMPIADDARAAKEPVENAATNDANSNSPELEAIMRRDPELAQWLDDAERRRIQVLVTIPEKAADGTIALRRLGYRVDADYFYPASSVKLGAAYGALEKLDEIRAEAKSSQRAAIHSKTPLRFILGEGRTRRVVSVSLHRDIERALVISDNEAFNRLFDFVGRSELAERLARVGLRSSRIIQHLGTADDLDKPPPIMELAPAGARQTIAIAERSGFELPPPPSREKAFLGSSHVGPDGRVVEGPMDFTTKNSISLRDLQDLLIAIARPEAFAQTVDGDAAPKLSAAHRHELMSILGAKPSELKDLRVTRGEAKKLDALYKPFHLAIAKAAAANRVKVFGKGGRAYGFAVENSYVRDESSGRSFFIAATIYANDNEMLNDDRYEYETVASPFLDRLAEVITRQLLLATESQAREGT